MIIIEQSPNVVSSGLSSGQVLAGLIYLLVMTAGILGTACFAGMETAIYSMSRLRLILRTSDQDVDAHRLSRETENASRLLSTLLIGTNACTFIASFGFTGLLTEVFSLSENVAITLEVVVLTFILFIFSETVPKEISRSYADVIVYRASSWLRMVRKLMTICGLLPFVLFTTGMLTRLFCRKESDSLVSQRAMIAGLVHEGVEHGTITTRQTALLERALNMQYISVKDRLTPWARVSKLNTETEYKDIISQRAKFIHRNYPVVNKSGKVLGVANLYDILCAGSDEDKHAAEPSRAVRVSMRLPVYVLSTMNVHKALRYMQQKGAKLAIVTEVKNDKKPVGIVTINDLVETLLGDFVTVA